MLTLARYAYHKLTYVRERSVTLLGLEGSGKTSLLEALSSTLDQPIVAKPGAPTRGVSLSRLAHSGLSLSVRDVGGSTSNKSNLSAYTNDDLIFFVVNASDTSRLDQVKSEISRISPLVSNHMFICLHLSMADSERVVFADDIFPPSDDECSPHSVFETGADRVGIDDLWDEVTRVLNSKGS
ncbi:hypothetical protein GEMRC1_011029 [Eukaryota sp. GEM-RC1]